MTTRNYQFRAADFADPERASKVVQDALGLLSGAIGAVRAQRTVSLEFVTAAVLANTWPVVLPRIDFGVASIIIGNAVTRQPDGPASAYGLSWSSRGDGGYQIDALLGLAVSTRHVLTLEVFGG